MVEEQLEGVVERITYRNEENGWTVLKVKPSGSHRTISVVMYGEDLFVGKTLEFFGKWIQHKSYGRQFEVKRAVEKEPESLDALQKYLGSGLISGVGPAMARKIVRHFGDHTLDVFENDIEKLLDVPGISKSKLSKIKKTWENHSATRTMVQYLQTNDIPISYATKLMDRYGASAPKVIEENPYRLIEELHGIGFVRADAIALATGIEPQSPQRIKAMVRYVLSRSKEEGNCYLLHHHIEEKLKRLDDRVSTDLLSEVLLSLEKDASIKSRLIDQEKAYYDNALYEAEDIVGDKIRSLILEDYAPSLSKNKIQFEKLEKSEPFPLSEEQRDAIASILKCPISILTGGPGCGKTTTLKLLVKLLQERKLKVMLAAPTGRAAQRMGDVIGVEAKTIHRLLSFNAITNSFKFNENEPLDVDFLIIDETSMLDIQLSFHLLSAIGDQTQVLFIGDVDQLPSVGAGNVLHDMIESNKVPVFRLSSVFRQAASSAIIRYAHQLNEGVLPEIRTPFKEPVLWKQKEDCMFIDSEVATQEQSDFIRRVKKYFASQVVDDQQSSNPMDYDGYTWDGFEVPEKFKRTNLTQVALSESENQGLRHILNRISPYSSIHYGLNALEMILRLYCTTIEQYYGKGLEIQLLTPMTKGILGTENLNNCIQYQVNPSKGERDKEVKVGKYTLREGDRVIQKRNNYNLEVFNGDIGHISTIEPRKKKIGVVYKDKSGEREVVYSADDFVDLDLAYAITIHKSQGSEFDAVIIPLAYQHFTMLTRNLVYTGMTRGKKLVVFVGNRGALRRAASNTKQIERLTYLSELIQS
ncbi:SF1B family DNA helicase RecD2 [Halosquirtibacter xylanolyticus]|uniref:SF1B family DNA helicase RecD2 n=1 Tax=Halosquirtibacter xylanolyticus TaxID=3374599 RepID=UPI00374A2E6B